MSSTPAPADDITGAMPIRIGGSTGFPFADDVSGATTNPGEPTLYRDTVAGIDHTTTNRSVFYSYTPASDGTARFSTDGSNYDTTLIAYRLADPSRPVSYSNIVEVTGNNDDLNTAAGFGRADNSTISFPVTGGQTYYIQVGAAGASAPGTRLVFDPQGPMTYVVCYASGTRIRVSRGGIEVSIPVERLSVGDLAVTSSGELRPIRWIGSRLTECRQHPDPVNVMPVRIAADAVGPNQPARDLVVSPGHAIALDVHGEVLIPAVILVNGATITQETVESITYWHIELDSHDLLMAENMPAESYLDMGNRAFFTENETGDRTALPDATLASRIHTEFCRPFLTDGPRVDAARERLRNRATALGWRLEPASWEGTYLWADGKRIEPVIAGDRARFDFPAKAPTVWLVSETSVPLQVGYAEDLRQLGVALTGLWLQPEGRDARAIPLDDPLLDRGFYPVEDAPWRWTTGFSRLPSELWAGESGLISLHAAMIVGGLPRWVEPAA